MKKYSGVYYIQGSVFDAQIVVMEQLNPEKHNALRILSRNVKEDDARRFLKESENLTDLEYRKKAKVAFEFSAAVNADLYKKLESDESMRKAMEDLRQNISK